ncbi:hypothetical protein KXX11_009399 [Aspergillus fumigatus]|nr:hypothetical protein KXX11_009399 [Aspergillus fumigatus]
MVNNPPPYRPHSTRKSDCRTRLSLIARWIDADAAYQLFVNRYFGRKPTSVTSESNVRIGESAMPWERDDDGKIYKYQYHPHGDKSQPLRNAPSALNTVIVPNVTLPVDLHERFNKYGKEEWDY